MDYRQLKLDKGKGKTIIDYGNIPDQRGGAKPLIQPGDYLFRLPKNLDLAWAEPFEATIGEQKFERVAVVFDEEHPLTIIKAGKLVPGVDPVGETVRARVTNAERNRARKGDPAAYVSDMYYFLFEGLGMNGTKPNDNLDWITALNKFAGKEFVAFFAWTANCNPRGIRYIDDGSGGSVEDPEKTPGCGTRYYLSAIPKDESGLYLERFNCGGKRQVAGAVEDCGASLRCFGQLERFRPATFAAGW